MKQLPLFDVTTKRCQRCRKEKSRNCFGKHKQTADRLETTCRECLKAYQAAYYAKNKESVRAKSIEYRAGNKEKLKSSNREYYLKNKYKYSLSSAARYLENKEKIKARTRSWSLNNIDKRRAHSKQWARLNRDKIKNTDRARRARAKKAPDGLTTEGWSAVIKSASGICSYCLKQYDKLELDHVIPLTKSGGHSIDNVVAACRSCNAVKSDRGPLFMFGWYL